MRPKLICTPQNTVGQITQLGVAATARFDSRACRSYINRMVQLKRTPMDLPPDIARRFVRDMRAYFAEQNAIERDDVSQHGGAAARG